MSYQHWPETGRSYDTAMTIAIWAATVTPAMLGRFYMGAQRRQPLDLLGLVLVAWILMVTQSVVLIAACYHGWGSSVDTLPAVDLHKAEKLYFASNILLILTHGCSRACMLLTLARIQHRRTLATYAVLSAICAWLIGSVLGIVLNRLSGPSYWYPVGADCRYIMWLLIYVFGLAVDSGVSALGIQSTFALQTSMTRRIFINAVFSADILVIVPGIYAVSYLEHHTPEIIQDPTLHSVPFIMANQVGLWTSMWCRFLEIAYGFRDEMGHATFGYGDKFSQVKSPRRTAYDGSDSNPKRPTYTSGRRRRREEAEDEIELAPTTPAVVHNSNVESNEPQHDAWSAEGIMQHRSFRVESEDASA